MVEKILSSEWIDNMDKDFLKSEEMSCLLKFLKERKEKGVKIYPKTGDVFKAFNRVSPEKIKAVLCLQDPYHKPGVADGLCMSCSYSPFAQPTLRHFLKEIEKTVKKENPLRGIDLSYLADQGVLLLNRTLTVEEGKPNSHLGKWDFFQAEIFKIVKQQKNPIVYMLLGKDALWFTRFIRQQDLLLTAAHPASAVYAGGTWSSQNIFNRCNEFLIENGIEPINW